MTRRIFVDTEWTAPPWTDRCELMWVGLADEQGHSWYGISSEVDIDPRRNDFMAGVFGLIRPDEPRLPRAQLAAEVVAFCGEVDEFWAWIPTADRFAQWFGLSDDAAETFAKSRDVDLRMLRALVSPWPAGWPDRLNDLNAAAAAAGAELPLRAANHLHPRVHAEWNRQLFERIRASLGNRTDAMTRLHFDTHDGLPAEATARVDRGLGEFNDQAAPLHEVRPLSCFVRDAAGRVIGGAIGRRWGALCELQQLWVDTAMRGQGLGAGLVRTFERHAADKGCTSFYLETLSFQAPDFYKRLGYRVAYARSGYPHGIVKYHMVKEAANGGAAT